MPNGTDQVWLPMIPSKAMVQTNSPTRATSIIHMVLGAAQCLRGS
jgi:hypothetical protein